MRTAWWAAGVLAVVAVGCGSGATRTRPAPPATSQETSRAETPPARLAPMPADCSAEAAPSHPLVASIGGETLRLEPSLWPAGSISDGEEPEPDFLTYRFEFAGTDAAGGPVEIDVTVLIPANATLAGRSFRKLPVDDTSAQPGPQEGTPEVQGWSVDQSSRGVDASHVFEIASLRLDVGTPRGGTLPARVRLCAPGVGGGTQLAGAFDVALPAAE
jgi:hypothetical protein